MGPSTIAEVVGTARTAGLTFLSLRCALVSLIFPISNFSHPLLLRFFCLVCEKWDMYKQKKWSPGLKAPPVASPPSGPTGCGQGLRVVICLE